MGQKVNPIGFRTGIMIGWKSRWYASKQEFRDLLIEDHKIRKFIKEKYKFAGIPEDRDRADPRRSEGHAAHGPAGHHHRPQGAGSRAAAGRAAGPDRPPHQHQDRRNHPAGNSRPAGGRGHRRAVGQAGQLPPHDEAGHRDDDGSRRQGNQDSIGRRLGGSEMARREKAIAGSMPLSTLRAKIDYGFTEAKTPKGTSASKCGSTKACTRTTADGADAQEGQAPKKPKRTYKR